ncbi:MAG: aspartate-alanine antiporter [Muribaculaceae bacterium]|nr:aspartate-alanine antiporter [Muribaculaceae bacterium]
MEGFIEFFRTHPLIAVFLTVGLGFRLGKVRIGGFSLGAVAATLIVGVIVGQMRIALPDVLKNVFFLFFLFAIGYNVGPQFFRSFRGPGLRMAGFAVCQALICAATVWVAARLAGYNHGIAAGLFAGSQTASASLGILADTARSMQISAEERDYLLMIIPACYAVTYVFGTAGSAWFLSVVGPKMLGGLDKVKAQATEMELQMDGKSSVQASPGEVRAGRPVVFRAYMAEGDWFSTPRTVADIEALYASKGARIVVERIKTAKGIETPTPTTTVAQGDSVVIAGRREAVIESGVNLGPECIDAGLLNFSAEKTPVTISSKAAGISTLGQLRAQDYMNGVLIAEVRRGGMRLPVRTQTPLQAGDVITLVGFPRDIAEAASHIGYADPPGTATDMVFLGLGIAAGCALGSVVFTIGGLPLSPGMSVGTLIAGLVLGWLRHRHPSFGHIPPASVWLLNQLGINMFIAVIGITAGASFLHGIHEAGILIFLVGMICTLVTLTLSILLASKVFRFPAPVALGCVAGGRLAVAAIGAVLDRLDSDVPNLGYTITYAVANISLVFSALLILLI